LYEDVEYCVVLCLSAL